jgi:hypothetical protein
MMPVHVGDRLTDRAELHQDDFHPDPNYVDRGLQTCCMLQRCKVQCSWLCLAEKQTLRNEVRQCNDQEVDFEQNTETSTIK